MPRNFQTIIGVGLSALALGAASAESASADDSATTEKTVQEAGKFKFDHVSCKGAPFEIRIVVEGVKKNQGLVTADLYPNDQEHFLRKRGRVKMARYAAKTPATKFCMSAPEAGLFAIAIYHDRNANADFDKTGIGLPAEPWGLSNNPKARFGPPPIEKALFEVTEAGATLAIKLN